MSSADAVVEDIADPIEDLVDPLVVLGQREIQKGCEGFWLDVGTHGDAAIAVGLEIIHCRTLMTQPDSELLQILDAIRPILSDYLQSNSDRGIPVCPYVEPETLASLLDLTLPEDYQGIDKILDRIRDVLHYSVRTGHPLFLDKLYAGSSPIGQVGELLAAILNTNTHVFSVAPVFTLMEIKALKTLNAIFFEGKEEDGGDGITCPGGSFANLLALLTARNITFPQVKSGGMQAVPVQPIILASQGAHYSVTKNAVVLGFGQSSLIKVPTNEFGEMIPSELEKVLSEIASYNATLETGQDGVRRLKKVPFFLQATSGTTVTCAFDRLDQIGEICNKHSIWMHVDACWGGSVILSQKHKRLMRGSELARSVAWNPHKALGVPIHSSFILMREKGLLQTSNALGEAYLFHGNDYDLGDKTIQCGRRPDILKFFLTWQYYGRKYFEDRIDLAFRHTDLYAEKIKNNENFHLVTDKSGLSVCFYHLPPQFKSGERKVLPFASVPSTPEERDSEGLLDKATTLTHKLLLKRGRVIVDFSPHPVKGKAHFFRLVFNSQQLCEADLDFVIKEVEESAAVVYSQM
eukprot:TRINITY_DN12380_c0_g1_i1.p1 TRINITY_DN12380_c0_g1~~TRINITY_DN12380_c0_g1_i1.p1  ORF type:complete len:577 (+),score=160.75 TRINITY_DN12380_c0_g1_i1:1364-3094(+)